MEPNPNPLRGRLLAQFEPDRDELARYRAEVEAMLEQKERSLVCRTRTAHKSQLDH